MAAAGYHVPAGSHPDFVSISFLRFILGDAPSGRLYKALVETGKAASAFCFARSLHDPGMLLVGAEVRNESSLDDAKDILIRVTEEAAVDAPTRAEVDRARENALKNWETVFRNSEWVAVTLSEWAAQGDWRLMFLHRDRIKAVTPEDVARVARAYLRPENRTVGVYIPTKEPQRAEIPPPPDVRELVRNYKGGEGLALGEEFDSSPAAIEARLIRADIPPGIKLVMLPKKTRGAIAQVVINLDLGDEKSLQGRATAGSFAGSMLMRGTAKKTRQQIKDETDRLKAQLGVYGYSTGASASLEVARENLPAALRLAAEILREPSFPAPELELLRQEFLASHEDSKSDPAQKANTRLQKHLNPWPKQDPRYQESPEESIEAAKGVTLDQVKRFHADFYGVSSAQIAVVGDFDPGEIKALLTELFSGWKNARPFARLVTVYQDRPAIHESIEAPDKESAYFKAGLRIDMRDDAAEYPALVLGDFMTGGGFLNSRLAERLRQKEGISYGAGSYFYASPLDRDAYFGSSAIYAPQNAERLLAAYNEELAKILAKGFTPEEIREAKKGWLQERTVSRAMDRELAYSLVSNEYLGRTLAWDDTLEKKVQALTNEEIVAAMRKFIDPAKISTVQSGDFAKVKRAGVQGTEGGKAK
jgi:zinc protease